MTHNFEPGDVAMVQKNGGEWHRAIRNSDNDEWICYHGIECGPRGVRPLVVIDPEDREQVERLNYVFQRGTSRSEVDNLQAALRSLIEPPKPPKPEEPTGLGAVVEDAEGAVWVRGLVSAFDEHAWRKATSSPLWLDYDRIDAVKVLGEGVPS